MFKNLLIIILAVSTAVLAWVTIQLTDRITLAEQALSSATSLKVENGRLAQEKKDLREKVRQLPIGGTPELLPNSNQIEVAAPSRNDMVLAKLYGDKATYMDVINYYKGEQRPKYAPLISRLHLSPADEEALRSILARDASNRMENAYLTSLNGVNGMNSSVIRDLDVQLHDDLTQLLGAERTAVIEKLRKVPIIEGAALATASMMSAIGEPLNDAQFDTLSNLLSQTTALSKSSSKFPLKLDDLSAADTYIKGREIANQQIIATASGVLSQAQIVVLRTQLNDLNAKVKFYIDAALMAPRREGVSP